MGAETAGLVENDEEKSVKNVTKGIGTGIGLGILGTVGAPLVGAAAVYGLATHGDEYSDQSDNED